MIAKIVVLDDDPTGSQTVHGIPIYTNWSQEALREALKEPSKVVFLLTNSRALSPGDSAQLHSCFMTNLSAATEGQIANIMIISRSDSTLRGHFPLETNIIKQRAAEFGQQYNGTVLIPAFIEGERFTHNDIHYVVSRGKRIPVGETEYAKDVSFGFNSSNLKEWVEEKTEGLIPCEDVISISVQELEGPYGDWLPKLRGKSVDSVIIVNATEYAHLERFGEGLKQLWAQGYRFLFRTAASWVKVIGEISSQSFLTKEDVVQSGRAGVVVVGSHVTRTSQQLHELLKLPSLEAIEYDVTFPDFEAQSAKIAQAVEDNIQRGVTSVVYTTREFQVPGKGGVESEDALAFSQKVSEGIVDVIRNLRAEPGFILAKGGITSSDIAVKGLGVRRALVKGQIASGISVWRLGKESRFPDISYIVFPGNVGERGTLRDVVLTCMG